MANTLLKIKGLKVSYGGIKAVKGIDMEVREGELISLIGSNGAGKTTTMKAVTGSLAQDRWEQDGQKRSKVYVKAQRVDFIGGKAEGGSPHPDPAVAQAETQHEDDDIPF